MISFDEFFEALWKSDRWPRPEPFPWQRMLAERITSGQWPEVIELPTACGKTACLDIAVYNLACQARQLLELRTAPRRIWFVVDRRIVVDEAFERAKRLADKLQNARSGAVQEVAGELRFLSGTERPLAIARLRGGIMRDDGWARIPSQPAVICSTVDQLGSALLFRGYGHNGLTAAIYAGLAAHDSLILLDEAHCAVPFLQTLRSITTFRGEKWAEQPLRTPFRFAILSATPPAGVPETDRFPEPHERGQALNHPILVQRLSASKPAQLAEAELPKRNKKEVRPFITTPVGEDALIADAAQRAMDFVILEGKIRVAVMVNRVAAAERVACQLRQDFSDHADIVLLTGRMRPLERDRFLKTWEPRLRANSPVALERPVILVSTQCLEVGADFSFDALVTECASLDSLRQRFGRLDRLGTIGSSPAVILIRSRDAKGKEADPIYGTALAETWRWLQDSSSGGSVNFGVNALKLPAHDRLKKLLAPADDAPVLLPIHLDFLCQTAPTPSPEPDISLLLHGKQGSDAEVKVLWRSDLKLPADRKDRLDVEETWFDTLALVPPASPEILTVRLPRLRRWLEDGGGDDTSPDLECAVAENNETHEDSRREGNIPFLLWRGRTGDSILSFNPRHIRPGDTVVLPGVTGMDGLGQRGQITGMGNNGIDLAEDAFREARGRAVLRIHSGLWKPWMEVSTVRDLMELASSEEWERETLEERLRQVLEAPLPEWLLSLIRDLGKDYRVEQHPAGGLILFGRKRLAAGQQEEDQSADADDLSSGNEEPVLLVDHTADVSAVALDSASRCLPSSFWEAFESAALCHDLGKLDPRFQVLLHNGDVVSAENSAPLGKSARLPLTVTRRQQIYSDTGLPHGFRHEFLSAQLVDQLNLCAEGEITRDLVCHLVASHHGYARPFAPMVPDSNSPSVDLSSFGIKAGLSAKDRMVLAPYHQLGAGIPARFWRLTRRYGWWGIAYLEAIFRLADWEASRRPRQMGQQFAPARKISVSKPVPPTTMAQFHLDALDGANPLAYLAALGTLRLLTIAFPRSVVRLGWKARLAAWRPVIETCSSNDTDDLIKALLENGVRVEAMFTSDLLNATETSSPKNKNGESSWKDKLKFPLPAYRDFCLMAAANASHRDRVIADYAGAWASELSSDFEKKDDLVRRTRFDFTAGQQSFISMLRDLRERLEKDGESCLQSALFKGWRYSRDTVSMRWDPVDEKRQYALQAVNPTNGSKNPPLADPGANFLAIEALPLFPMVPDRSGSQPGFTRVGNARCWRWVIWETPAELDVVRTLVALRDRLTPAVRSSLGIVAVFQSAIVQPSGRYRCFTPAGSV